MLFGYFSTSIFQDALASVYCVNVFILYSFVCFLFRWFFPICVLGNDWVDWLRATIKSRSHHYAWNSNDWFNYSSLVCIHVGGWVCVLSFLRYTYMNAFVGCANASLVEAIPLIVWSSSFRFQTVGFLLSYFYYCWYSGALLGKFCPHTHTHTHILIIVFIFIILL